ncbi:uncharacterized protein LOC135494624 isoform X1 [Lineus longissimus]|uniref:uncharacterized protein LOC135494624 isoform X1 n=1 Tax=Lineus longissimus TaxID=88925 RepID=UPI00315DBECD
MAARKHPNGEMTLDKESANELLTFIARFNQVLNTTEVSQPTQQAGELYDNGRASRQVGPEEDDEQQKQERKETLTMKMPGYGAPPPSQPNSACMTLTMPVQASLSTNSTPRNSSCVLSEMFTTMDFSRPNSQRSSSSHPGVQPSSARESFDSGITEGGLTRRKAADDRRPESAPGTRQVSVRDYSVRLTSPATCESSQEVDPATSQSNNPLLTEAAVPNPVRGGNIGTIDREGTVGRRQDNAWQPHQAPSVQFSHQPERNGSQQNDREALMKISDRITTIVQGLKKKPTYTSEEVRTILEEIMEETPIVCNKNRQCRRSKGHIHRKAMYLEDGQCDLSANGNATKQTAKRPSEEASAAFGEEEVGENKIMTRNKRQKPRRLDDDESCA